MKHIKAKIILFFETNNSKNFKYKKSFKLGIIVDDLTFLTVKCVLEKQ